MVEAIQTLPPQPSRVLITLARLATKEAVKRKLRDQGLKPQCMSAREINAAADVYLEAHVRELVEEAWRLCQRSPELMKLYEKEQRERQRKLERNSKHLSNSQSPANLTFP